MSVWTSLDSKHWIDIIQSGDKEELIHEIVRATTTEDNPDGYVKFIDSLWEIVREADEDDLVDDCSVTRLMDSCCILLCCEEYVDQVHEILQELSGDFWMKLMPFMHYYSRYVLVPSLDDDSRVDLAIRAVTEIGPQCILFFQDYVKIQQALDPESPAALAIKKMYESDVVGEGDDAIDEYDKYYRGVKHISFPSHVPTANQRVTIHHYRRSLDSWRNIDDDVLERLVINARDDLDNHRYFTIIEDVHPVLGASLLTKDQIIAKLHLDFASTQEYYPNMFFEDCVTAASLPEIYEHLSIMNDEGKCTFDHFFQLVDMGNLDLSANDSIKIPLSVPMLHIYLSAKTIPEQLLDYIFYNNLDYETLENIWYIAPQIWLDRNISEEMIYRCGNRQKFLDNVWKLYRRYSHNFEAFGWKNVYDMIPTKVNAIDKELSLTKNEIMVIGNEDMENTLPLFYEQPVIKRKSLELAKKFPKYLRSEVFLFPVAFWNRVERYHPHWIYHNLAPMPEIWDKNLVRKSNVMGLYKFLEGYCTQVPQDMLSATIGLFHNKIMFRENTIINGKLLYEEVPEGAAILRGIERHVSTPKYFASDEYHISHTIGDYDISSVQDMLRGTNAHMVATVMDAIKSSSKRRNDAVLNLIKTRSDPYMKDFCEKFDKLMDYEKTIMRKIMKRD